MTIEMPVQVEPHVHRRMEQYLDRLRTLRETKYDGIVLVVAAARYGKSTSSMLFELECAQETFDAQTMLHSWYKPAVYIECIAADRKAFDWTEHMVEHHEKLSCCPEIMVRRKPIFDDDYDSKKTALFGKDYRKAATTRAVEKAMKYRRTESLLWDEAESIFRVANYSEIAKNVRRVTSFSNRSGASIALIGGYPLLNIYALDAQLAGRCRFVIHLPPYDASNAEDLAAILGILRYLDTVYPTEPEGLFSSNAEFIYESALGIPGQIFQVAEDSCRLAYNAKLERVTIDCLKGAVPTKGACEVVKLDIATGQDMLKRIADGGWATILEEQRNARVGRTGRKVGVGKRNPHRDYVPPAT